MHDHTLPLTRTTLPRRRAALTLALGLGLAFSLGLDSARAGVGVGEPTANYGDCPTPTEFSVCTIDLQSGAFACDNGTPLSLAKIDVYGPVYRLDMSDWDVAIVDVEVHDALGWWFHLGNSQTNNGWSGDSGQTSNDSEAHILDGSGSLSVYRSDLGGSGLALSQGGAIDLNGDVGTAVVSDGYFGWDSSTVSTSVSDPHIFQIDGDEADPERKGLNDQLLWLGIGQTVGSKSRNGSGVTQLTVTFGR